MKYRISASERWSFYETYKLSKDGVNIDLEYKMKWGSVIVDLDDPSDLDGEFASYRFNDDVWEIEDTGDESLEDWDVYAEDGERIRQELEDGYDEDSDEYYDFREYLEYNGWEYNAHEVFIPDIEVEVFEE